MAGDFPTWVWLSIYGGCVISGVLTLGLLVFRRLRTPMVWMFLQASLIAIALFAAADFLRRFLPTTEASSNLLSRPAFLLVAVSAGALIMLCVFLQSRWCSQRPWWIQWGRHVTYLAGYGIAAAGLGQRFYQVTEPPRQWQSELDLRGDQRLSDVAAYAVTDSGRRFPLYRFESTELAKSKLPDNYLGKVVVVKEGENSRANCHGWVFTGGRFLVRSTFVDDILSDNGYAVVESPLPGDLIIYRNPSGQPVHTGVVKAAGQDGFVLIESKWGALGTYLHLPEVQIYSNTYAFYRSVRPDHHLTIVDENGTASSQLAEQTSAPATIVGIIAGRDSQR
jgi:hypothetical protein